MTEAAVLLSVLAAGAFALGTVLQQKGTLETPAGQDDPRFLVQTVRRPVWLVGALLQGVGWVLQAAALDRGTLMVVQALIALNVVLVLPLGIWLTDQHVTAPVWIGACCVVVGVIVFLSTASPTGGTSGPTAADWLSGGLLCLVVVALLARSARRRPGARAALLFGAAAGTCFAFQGAVTKAFVPLVGQGLAAMLSSWTIYALLVSAVLGFVLQQSALKTGVLAPATAASNALTLFGSVIFGKTVFHETTSAGLGHLGPALLGLGAVAVGMWLLAGDRSQPQAAGVATRS